MDRAAGARRELDKPEIFAGGAVNFEPPSDPLVERLRAVDRHALIPSPERATNSQVPGTSQIKSLYFPKSGIRGSSRNFVVEKLERMFLLRIL